MSCHMMRQIEETDARTARVAAELADFGYSIYTASVVVLVLVLTQLLVKITQSLCLCYRRW